MRIDTRPRKRNAVDPAGKRCEPYLKWLRGRNCILGHTGECEGKVRACHWDQAGDKGMGTKVSDQWAFPMCDGHHGEQHRIGWPAFVAKHKLRMREICERFWGHWLHRTAMGTAWKRKEAA